MRGRELADSACELTEQVLRQDNEHAVSTSLVPLSHDS